MRVVPFQQFTLQRKVRLVVSSLYHHRKGFQTAALKDGWHFSDAYSVFRKEQLAYLVAKILHMKFRVTTVNRKLS